VQTLSAPQSATLRMSLKPASGAQVRRVMTRV
jgi:hypothetical protein